MDDITPYALKELLEAKLGALDRLTSERFAAQEKALNLKSEELARRLDALNGEATRLAKVLSESVPREVYAQFVAGLAEWKSAIDQRLSVETGRDAAGQTARNQMNLLRTLGVTIVLGLLALAVRVFWGQ